MAFTDDMISDLGTVFFLASEGAVEATYGGETILLMPMDYDTTIQDPEAVGDERDYEVRVSDMARPVAGDVITIGSVTWYIKRILSGGAEFGTWKIRLSSATRRRV